MGRPKAGPARIIQIYFGLPAEQIPRLDEARDGIPRHVYVQAIVLNWLRTNPEAGKLP